MVKSHTNTSYQKVHQKPFNIGPAISQYPHSFSALTLLVCRQEGNHTSNSQRFFFGPTADPT